jgi:parvulin-like peptidyl-prolyl isomerase
MNKDTKVGDFVQELKSNSDLRATPLTTDGFTRAINKLTDPEAFEKATVNIETEYPEFGILIKEFYDGILLFKVETLEVWDKLKFDSTLARAYYDSTKTRYKTQPKYDISEIYVTSDSLAQHIYSELKAGAEFSDLAEKFTQRTGFREKKGHWGKIGEKENKLAKIAADIHLKEGEYSTPQAYEKGFSIIRLNLFEPVRQKTFEEAIPDFAPAVQDILQKKLSDEWIAKLKKKYNITIFEQNLKMIRK